MVSRTVLDILLRLRETHDGQLIWLDLICINQDSVKDRELQVSRMADIFRRARMVIVSLGPHYDSDAWRYKGLQENCSRHVQTYGTVYHWSVLQHPWFQRVWVVQEMAFASQVRIICGGPEISGSQFAGQQMHDFTKRYDFTRRDNSSRREKSALLERTADLLAMMSKGTHMLSMEIPTPMAHKLQIFRAFKANLPADKVYALMELCTPSSRIRINYDISYKQVFINAACKVFEQTSSLGLLCYREPRSSTDSPNLPSWVPDWTKAFSPPGYEHTACELSPSESPIRGIRMTDEFPIDPRRETRHPTLVELRDRYVPLLVEMARDGKFVVLGQAVACITSLFNDGSIEVKLAMDDTLDKPYAVYGFRSPVKFANALSHHLMDVHRRLVEYCGEGLKRDDEVCMLRGASGLAVLRRNDKSTFGDDHCLISLDHSQYHTFGTIWDAFELADFRRRWSLLRLMFTLEHMLGRVYRLSMWDHSLQDGDKLFGQPMKELQSDDPKLYTLR